MAMRDALRKAGYDVPPEEPERMDDMARRPNQGGSGGGNQRGGSGGGGNRGGGGGQRGGGGGNQRRDWRPGGGGNQRQDRRPGGGGNQARPPLKMPEFPDAYFAPDAKGNLCLRTEFVEKEKMDDMARKLARNAYPNLTTGQARRFFNHCRDIERRLHVEGESWQSVAARFESLSSFARYAQGPDDARSPGKIPAEFREFIDANVRRVKSSDDPGDAFLRGFLPHFEALIGFGSAYMRRG